VIVALASVLAVLGSWTAAGAQDATPKPKITAPPPPAQRDRPAINSELNVLNASADEIEAELNTLETQLAAQRAAFDAAATELATASQQVADADAAVVAAQDIATTMTTQVQQMAIDSYINPRGEQQLDVFMSASPSDAAMRQTYLDDRAATQAALLEKHRKSIVQLESARSAAAEAQAAAQQAADSQAAALAQIEATHATKQAFADELNSRIEANLGEIASLDAVDRQRAASLAVEQQRIAVLAKTASQPLTTSPATTVAPVPGQPSPPTTAPRVTTPPTTPPTTTPPRVVPPPLVRPGEIVFIAGFGVNKSVAGPFGQMMDAATAAGLDLGGGGYRDPASQIALRRAHCGPTDYDIYDRPSSQCSPPTARPGQSMHEQGLALDFTCSGTLISSQSGECWDWLATNAASYGFFNLPSEPWHWSVNGR